jgi:signal transduction histidine kinase
MRALARDLHAVVLGRDLWLALGVFLVLVVGTTVNLPEDLWSRLPRFAADLLPDGDEMLLLLVGSLPLAFRRVAPLPVLGVCVTASLLVQAVEQEAAPLPLGVLVALYTVAVLRRPLVCGAATLGYVAALAAGGLTDWAPISDDLFYTYLVAVAAAVVLGYGVALGRARATLAEQRAAELAREQEARTQAAVEQEQSRIAREVHDLVAHDVSVIVAQAAASRRVLSPGCEEAARALGSIETLGRDALDGLRRLVTPLRSEGQAVPRSPQPGLDLLPQLVAQVRRAGLPVELEVRGRAAPLPAAVELNAYRIVQEALTNSLKHAGAARARVTLDYLDDALRIHVRDEPHRCSRARALAGRPPGNGTEARQLDEHCPGVGTRGFGLVSMRQRAAMLGGEFTAGSDPGPGFHVRARLPLDGATR